MFKMKMLWVPLLLVSLILLINFPFVEANNNSYYSKENAPEFYGLTKAIIQKGDSFSINDARYRIFAKDFEDGDLTQKIVAVSNVDTSKIGNYEIKYEVTDSDNNKTTLTVPIEVVENEDGRYYERTLYSLPSVWNMTLAGTNRGNNHDRQMLGFYMKAGSSISVKKISGTSNLSLTYLNNDSETEKTFSIKDEYVEITSSYDGVPFIKTLYEQEEPIVIAIKENDSNAYSLPYYHNGDNETSFFTNWENIVDSYGVVESEDITVLIPYYDKDKLVNYYNNCFHSLDEFFAYWHKVMNEYDEYLGLEYNPDNSINQNVKTKYFAKANIHGAGAAYYAWDHIGINSNSVASYFEVNWGGLHEVGHGYQGSLANDLEQGEVSNNILGHYVQINRDIYPYEGNWLGNIDSIEEQYQSVGKTGDYYDLSLAGRLYYVVNLLDIKDSKKTYAEINKIWRKSLYNKENISTMDAYALAFYNLYNLNIVPYFDSWNLSVSSKVKETVATGEIPSQLMDIINDQTESDKIKTELKKDGNYSLVTQDELKEYNLKSNLKLTISIDDINELIGKKIIIQNGTIKQEKTITSEEIEFSNLLIGTYQIILPVPKDNVYDYIKYNYVNVTLNETANYNLTYTNTDQMDLTNDTKIEFRGLGDQIFSTITFDKNNLNITTFNLTPHVYFEEVYTEVKIYDLNDNLVYTKEYEGNKNYSKELETIKYEIGYKISIMHKEAESRLVFNNQLLNSQDKNLKKVKDIENVYIIGKYGLYEDENKAYKNYLEKIDDYALKIKNELTEEQINNKNIYSMEKSKLLTSILKLDEPEKEEYLNKYKNIYNGSSPELLTNIMEINQDDDLNFYTLKASDLEDQEYSLTKLNSKFYYDIPKENNLWKSGKYTITYEIKDSDDNITKGEFILIIKKINSSNDNKEEITDNKKDDEIVDNKTNDEIDNNKNDDKIDDSKNDIESKNETVEKVDNNYSSNEDVTYKVNDNISDSEDTFDKTEENISDKIDDSKENTTDKVNEKEDNLKENKINYIIIGGICFVIIVIFIIKKLLNKE